MQYSKHTRAFSLAQILVSLAIGGLLLGAVTLFLSKTLSRSAVERAREDLIQQHLFIRQKLKDILNTAIKVDGYSLLDPTTPLPGIARLDLSTGGLAGPRVGDENDAALFHVHPNPFAAPVSGTIVETPTGNSTHLRLNVPTAHSNDDESHNVYRYLAEALRDTTRSYFSVTSSQAANLFIRDLNVIPTGTNMLSVDFLRPQNFDPQQHVRSANFIRPALRYELYVAPNGELVLKQKRKPDDPGSLEVLANRVRSLRVEYLFGENETFLQDPILPTEYLSHPRDPIYYGPTQACTPQMESLGRCVDWDNIVNVRLSVDLASEIEVPEDLVVDESSGFRVEDGQLIYRSFISMTPTAFDPFRYENTLVDSQNCSLADPYSKCNPQCAEIFGSTNPLDPNWQGYADMDSNYCKCGLAAGALATNDPRDFIPPDFSEIYGMIPNWSKNSPGGNTAIDYCIGHFGPCHPQWKTKDPRARMVCGDCLYNGEDYRGGGPGNYFYTNLSDLETDLRTGSAALPMKCGKWQTCDSITDLWLNSPPTPFRDRCQCLFYEIDAAGDPTDQPIQQKDYSQLCRLPDAGGCDANFYENTAGEYYFKLRQIGGPDELKQGFSLREAALCTCTREHHSGSTNPSSRHEFRETANWGAPPAGDPQPAVSVSPAAGSRDTKRSDVRFVNGTGTATQTEPNYSCSEAQCNVLGSSVGCCILGGTPNAFSSSLPAYPNHGTYCSNQCISPVGFTDPSQVNSLRRVILFGSDTGQDLPWFCGGNTGGNGSGSGTIGN